MCYVYFCVRDFFLIGSEIDWRSIIRQITRNSAKQKGKQAEDGGKGEWKRCTIFFFCALYFGNFPGQKQSFPLLVFIFFFIFLFLFCYKFFNNFLLSSNSFCSFFFFHSRPLHQLKDALNFILAFFPLHLCGIFSSLWTMWDIIFAATQNAQTHAWSWAQSLSLALVASTKDHWLGYLALLWNTIFMMNISFSLPLAA